MLFLLSAVLAGCRHDWGGADNLASEIRCGMSTDQIHELARKHGVDDPAKATYEQYGSVITVKPRELDFVDVWLENGKAIAVQAGNYVSFSTGMEFGPVRPLCGQYVPPGARIRVLARTAV